MTGATGSKHGSDCYCITHDGPHWQHMDRLHREINRDLLRAGQDETRDPWNRWMALMGFATEERLRLQNKLPHLIEAERDKIDEAAA